LECFRNIVKLTLSNVGGFLVIFDSLNKLAAFAGGFASEVIFGDKQRDNCQRLGNP